MAEEQVASPTGMTALNAQLAAHRAWLAQTVNGAGEPSSAKQPPAGAPPLDPEPDAADEPREAAGDDAPDDDTQHAQLHHAARLYASNLRLASSAADELAAAAAGAAAAGAGARPPASQTTALASELSASAAAVELAEAALRGGAPTDGLRLESLAKLAARVADRRSPPSSQQRTPPARSEGSASPASCAASPAAAHAASAQRRASLRSPFERAPHGGVGVGASRSPPSSSEVLIRLETWAEARAARLAVAAATEPSAAPFLYKPAVCPRSLELVARMEGRVGPIEEQLMADASRKREALEAKAAAQLDAQLARARPAISQRARALDRAGDIAERLLAYGDAYAARRDELARKLDDDAAQRSVHARSPRAAAAGFARVNEASAYAAIRTQSVVERLAGARARSPADAAWRLAHAPAPGGLEEEALLLAGGHVGGTAARLAADAADADAHAPHPDERRFPFAPAICERSRAIAGKLDERPADRLLKPSRAAVARRAAAELEAAAAAGDAAAAAALLPSHELRELYECQFRPNILPASARLAESRRLGLAHAAAQAAAEGEATAAADRFQALYAEARTRKAALEKLTRAHASRALAECTFAPNLGGGGEGGRARGRRHSEGGERARGASPSQRASASTLGYLRNGPQGLQVAERLGAWARRREQRIEAKRHDALQQAMAACPFAPSMQAQAQTTPRTAGRERAADASLSNTHSASQLSAGQTTAPSPCGGLESSSEPISLRSAVSVSKFLQRQQAGRALEAQRRHVPHATGDGWTRGPTKTAEFAFATGGESREGEREGLRAHLSALKQPVTCSVGEAASRHAPPSLVAYAAIDTTRLFLADSYGDEDSHVHLQLRSPRPRSPRHVE